MDMARKFLQMGYTRSRRYANHKSGQKYASNPQMKESEEAQKLAREHILPQEVDWKDSEKAQSAQIFYEKYVQAKSDLEYLRLKNIHKQTYGK